MLLYIDPGTGSMLLTILIGIVSILYFFLQKLRIKMKALIHGGKIKGENTGHIPYVIYTDNKRYWNVFKPICDIFEEKEIPLVYWTSSADDPALDEDYKYVKRQYIGEVNKAVARLNMMDAGICLSTTPGLDVYQWKRSKNTKWYAHICHAVGDISAYRMFGTDYYDSIFLASGAQNEEVRMIEKAHNRPEKELPVAGLSYMDAMKIRLEAELNKNSLKSRKDDITVLVAPSWGINSILCKYGSEFIDGLLETGYKIVIRPHPQSLTADKDIIEPMMKKYSDSDVITWNFDNDNFNCLMESDIMISDFSGVIFDYVFVFDKPVIYADIIYDRGPYDAYWIDQPMWIFESLPKIGMPLKSEDFSDMKSVIDKAINDETLKAGREEVKNSGWQNRGKCAQTVADYMISKYDEVTTEEKSA